MQNTVLSQTFDVLWAEVVVWMRQIVRKHSDLLLEGKRDPMGWGNPWEKMFPQVASHGFKKFTVFSETFDVLWAEVVVWMRQVVHKHSDLLLKGKRVPKGWRGRGGGSMGENVSSS